VSKSWGNFNYTQHNDHNWRLSQFKQTGLGYRVRHCVVRQVQG